jgi:putative membrane protein
MAGPWVQVAPAQTATALGFILGGVALGTASGLTPGIHANTFALALAAVAGDLPGPPRLVAATMLAAGTAHTFFDVVPALALGVPDPTMAPSALPGHKLVLGGRGREALRLSVLASGLAVALAMPLALPVTMAMEQLWPLLRAHLSVVLAGVALALVIGEFTNRARVGAALGFTASGALGVVALPLDPPAILPVGGMLAPLFAGLFGAPVLLDSIGGRGVPPQDDPTVASDPLEVGRVGAIGTVAGAMVGYVPGVSSAVAATGTLVAIRRRGARAFVVATSSVNTATAIFALFAFVALGSPRTGIMVAVEGAGVPVELPLLLASVACAAAAGVALVPPLGDRYLATIGRLDATRLAVGLLGVLAVLAFLFAGPIGVGAFGAASVVGLVPPRAGARRVSLMGVLLVPLIL